MIILCWLSSLGLRSQYVIQKYKYSNTDGSYRIKLLRF